MGATIVLADDEVDLRTIYAACLRAAGYEVWEAADGRQALDLVEAHQPALLILDVWMPALNGMEVLDQLRHAPCSGSMKVVMLSSLGDSDTRLEGFSAGVTDYWVKGLSLTDLCERIKRVLAECPAAADRADY